MNTPYTYLIGWTQLDMWYYGVRYAKGCHPNDFWKTYFTSSDYISNFREKHGEPDVVQIRKTFDNSEKAILWEHNVLLKLNIYENTKWLNKNIGGHIVYNDEIRAKMSEKAKGRIPWNKNKKMNDKFCKKISESCKGRIAWNKGKSNSQAVLNGKTGAKKQSKTVTGRKMKTRADGTRYWYYPD